MIYYPSINWRGRNLLYIFRFANTIIYRKIIINFYESTSYHTQTKMGNVKVIESYSLFSCVSTYSVQEKEKKNTTQCRTQYHTVMTSHFSVFIILTKYYVLLMFNAIDWKTMWSKFAFSLFITIWLHCTIKSINNYA